MWKNLTRQDLVVYVILGVAAAGAVILAFVNKDHDNLAGGIVGAAGTILAGYAAWRGIQRQLKDQRDQFRFTSVLAASDLVRNRLVKLRAEQSRAYDVVARLRKLEEEQGTWSYTISGGGSPILTDSVLSAKRAFEALAKDLDMEADRIRHTADDAEYSRQLGATRHALADQYVEVSKELRKFLPLSTISLDDVKRFTSDAIGVVDKATRDFSRQVETVAAPLRARLEQFEALTLESAALLHDDHAASSGTRRG